MLLFANVLVQGDASTDATTRGIINQGSVTVTLRRQTAELPFGFGVGTGVSPFVLVAVAVVHDTVVDVPVTVLLEKCTRSPCGGRYSCSRSSRCSVPLLPFFGRAALHSS